MFPPQKENVLQTCGPARGRNNLKFRRSSSSSSHGFAKELPSKRWSCPTEVGDLNGSRGLKSCGIARAAQQVVIFDISAVSAM